MQLSRTAFTPATASKQQAKPVTSTLLLVWKGLKTAGKLKSNTRRQAVCSQRTVFDLQSQTVGLFACQTSM